jgi:hypothetical protein
MYAKENAEVYANNAIAALHEPHTWPPRLIANHMIQSVTVPEVSRTKVKVAGSIDALVKASLHSTEFAANAIIATVVNAIVRDADEKDGHER